jgi:hypothetical protein
MSSQPDKQGDREEHEKQNEEHLREVCNFAGDPTESEQCGRDRNDEKRNSPIQHGHLLAGAWPGAANARGGARRCDRARCRRKPKHLGRERPGTESNLALLVALSGALDLFATAFDVLARARHRIAAGSEERDEKQSHQ